MSIEHILQMLDRTCTGPVCTADDWNYKVLPQAVSQKLEKYALKKTCDTENPINSDDELADRFYEAGYELALELGIFCQDTERIIKIGEEELNDAVTNVKSELVLGKGRDTIVLKQRKPEDKLQPVFFAPAACLVSEDILVRLLQGIAKQPEIDGLRSPVCTTVYGHPPIAGTPYETAAGAYEAQLTKEALRRAGRPGMCVLCVTSSPTAYGQLGGYGTPRGFDPEVVFANILCPGELTTSNLH